ncbi:MAG: hypothetical protein A2W03_04040 [Candidatus Aminicenantes bacterium RBG_16_63_16]|nr:MAG: hypothetical protein A2W03_04040 [Candidatus Aminicenantes bacterium RBG_16_63_16]
MRRSGLILIAVAFLLGWTRLALAQFTPEELSQRPYWEKFLRTAPILRSEEIGEGVTRPYAVYLKNGDAEQKACWKNPSGIQDGFLEGWQYEIAAYELDKLVGLNMIPPTVEREFEGRPGALSYWATTECSLLQKEERRIEFPKEALPRTDNMKYLTRAWDCLVGNEDRTQQNVRYTKDWRTILIDHSRAFRSAKPFTERLMFGRNGIKKFADGKPILFRRLPRSFVEKVKALDFRTVRAAVGPYLTDKEIEAVLKRRTLLLAEIDELIRGSGEDMVLY